MVTIMKWDQYVKHSDADECLSLAGESGLIGMDEEVVDCGHDYEMAYSLAIMGTSTMVESV